MNRGFTFLVVCAALLVLLSCSTREDKPRVEAERSTEAPVAPPTKPEPTAEPPAKRSLQPGVVVGTPLQKRLRKTREGEEQEWRLLAGIEVQDASFRQVYESRGSSFVSFKAGVRVANENCLINWKAELIEGPTGRGRSVAQISGTVPARAGRELTVSGVVALSAAQVGQIGSASAGYWTLCGDALPRPSAFDFEITETRTEQIEVGPALDLHHTVMAIEGKAEGKAKARRCYFDLVAEDVDAAGYTLNRDFATFSLSPTGSGLAKLRRTTFEGGTEKDYQTAAVGKRSYLRNLSCAGPWTARAARIEGIGIEKLALIPRRGEPSSAEHYARASYNHRATLTNKIRKDCSFRVRYRILDKEGVPLNKSPLLSETLHLAKGQTVEYESSDQRLFVWLDQADEVGSLVVEKAGPIANCQRYDPSQKL